MEKNIYICIIRTAWNGNETEEYVDIQTFIELCRKYAKLKKIKS